VDFHPAVNSSFFIPSLLVTKTATIKPLETLVAESFSLRLARSADVAAASLSTTKLVATGLISTKLISARLAAPLIVAERRAFA
jgi:hypothetical protein